MPSYPGAIVPATPFPHPVPLPTLGTGLVTVSLDQGWLPYLVGAAKVLCAASTWDPPDPTTIQDTILAAYDLLQTLSGAQPGTCADLVPVYGSFDGGDMPLVRQNPTNPCQFQMQCPDGTWDTVFDSSLCVTNPAPGAGVTPPGPGGCKTYTLFPKASAITPMPFIVNSGDVLTVTSEMGAGSDGTLDWYCPDGSYFIAGACVGGAHLVSTDPLPTSPHMSLLLLVAGTYYPLPVGAFTVPGGITNKPAYIQVNDSSLSDDSGEYTVGLSYCNNLTPPPTAWCFDQDLTASPFAWTVNSESGVPVCGGSFSGPVGMWTPGQGLQGIQLELPDCVNHFALCEFGLDLGINVDYTVQFTINLTKALSGSDQFRIDASTNIVGSGATNLYTSTSLTAGSHVITVSSTALKRFIYFHCLVGDYSGSGSGAQITVSDIKFNGIGTNPFGSSNC